MEQAISQKLIHERIRGKPNARNLIENFRTDKSFVLLTASVDQQVRLRALSD